MGAAVGVDAGLDADHPGAGAGLDVQVDRTEVLDPGGRQTGHHVGRVRIDPDPGGDDLGLVGAPLAEDPALVLLQEPEEGPGQDRMGVDGPARRAHRVVAVGQVEEVAGDDEDAGTVPRVEGLGELTGQRLRGRRRLGCEQQVADDHDAPAEGYVDPGAAGVRV